MEEEPGKRRERGKPINAQKILNATEGSEELDQEIWESIPELPRRNYTRDRNAAEYFASRLGPTGSYLVKFDRGHYAYRSHDMLEEITPDEEKERLPSSLREPFEWSPLRLVQFALKSRWEADKATGTS